MKIKINSRLLAMLRFSPFFLSIVLLSFFVNATDIFLDGSYSRGDSWTQASTPAVNYGTETYTQIMTNTNSNPFRSFFIFDISNFTDVTTRVDNADLWVYAQLAEEATDYYVYHIYSTGLGGTTWGEITITHNNQPCGTNKDNSVYCNITFYSNTSQTAVVGWKKMNVTKILEREIKNGSKNFSIMLTSAENAVSTNKYHVITSEEGTASNRPKLNISYYVALDSDPPVITITSPTPEEHLDGSLYLFSVIGTSADGSGISSTWINNTLFANYGTNEAFNFSATGLSSGNYSLIIYSNDTKGNLQTKPFTILVDVLPPTIIDNIADHSTTSNYFMINTTALDNYLIFSYNMTCLDSFNNEIVANFTNNISQKNYTWAKRLNLTLNTAPYSLNCKNIVYDTHTDNDISKLLTKSTTTTKLEFFDEKTALQIETSRDNTITAIKTSDRYIFDISTNEDDKKGDLYNRNYTITSNSKIFYIENSRYKGHLVTGTLWLDFEGSDSKIEIIRINENSVLVKETSQLDRVLFHSVGVLNKAEYDFTITKEWDVSIPIGTTCPSTLENVLILAIAVFIVMVLTYISFAYSVPLLMFLCGFSMLILGFYFMPCIWGIASIFYMMGLLEIFLGIVGFLMS